MIPQKGKGKTKSWDEASGSCSLIDKRITRPLREGNERLQNKRKRLKASNGEGFEESHV